MNTVLFIDNKGDQSQSRAIVYLEDSVLVNGYILHGSSIQPDPETVAGADLIRKVDNVPSINGTEQLIKAYL